jgi:hypothetical protein
MLTAQCKGFQFTFSAPTVANFTEPTTPSRNRSPSVEYVKTSSSAVSLIGSLDHVLTPPATDYSSSSSYQPGEVESDSDSRSPPPSPVLCTKQLLPSLSVVNNKESAVSSRTSTTIATAAASLKRSFTARRTSTPPVSPKKKSKSAIRIALEKPSRGLLKFLEKCTPAEHHFQVQRATEDENEQYLQRRERIDIEKTYESGKVRENAKIRQQKHRQMKYDAEIARGERTPHGTKRVRKVTINNVIGGPMC